MPFFMRVIATRANKTLYDGIERLQDGSDAIRLLDQCENLREAVAAGLNDDDTSTQHIRQQLLNVHLSQENEHTAKTCWTRINDDVDITAMFVMFGYKQVRFELHPPPPQATASRPKDNAFATMMQSAKKIATIEERNLPSLNEPGKDGKESTGEKLLTNHVITSLKDHKIAFKSKSSGLEIVSTLTKVFMLLDSSVETIALRDVGIKSAFGSLGIGYVKEKSAWVRRCSYDEASKSHKVRV
jgi:hypothetical protein